MSAASGTLIEAFDNAGQAATAVLARGTSDFTFSPGSGAFDAETWDEIEYGLMMAEQVCPEFIGSLADVESDEYAVFPIGDFEFGIDPWPNEGDPDTVAVNLGQFFSSPIGLVASATELNKGTTLPNPAQHVGEPVWYKLDAETGSFPMVTLADFPPGPPYDFFGRDDTVYYWKMPDATLGGINHINNIPLDDPSTRYDDFELDYDDANFNSQWDAGETVDFARLTPAIEGVIDLAKVSGEYGTSHIPWEWYFKPDSLDTDIETLLLNETPDPAGLWAEIQDWVYVENGEVAALTFLDTLGSPTKALYYSFGAPDYAAWHSFTTEGTTGYDWYGDPIESAGSFWWAALEMISTELE
jgi:hypothetical protein